MQATIPDEEVEEMLAEYRLKLQSHHLLRKICQNQLIVFRKWMKFRIFLIIWLVSEHEYSGQKAEGIAKQVLPAF